MDEFKEGDIIIVVKAGIKSEFPIGFMTKVVKSNSLKLIRGPKKRSWFNLNPAIMRDVIFRHATDREKLLYYTHGQMVWDE